MQLNLFKFNGSDKKYNQKNLAPKLIIKLIYPIRNTPFRSSQCHLVSGAK